MAVPQPPAESSPRPNADDMRRLATLLRDAPRRDMQTDVRDVILSEADADCIADALEQLAGSAPAASATPPASGTPRPPTA